MRTTTSTEQAVLKTQAHGSRKRVRVLDLLGNWRDLSALEGYEWLNNVVVDEQQDQPIAKLQFAVRRQIQRYSLAQLVTDSKLNAASADPYTFGTYDPLLKSGRVVICEACLVPADVTPAESDWREVFRGDIDEVSWAGEEVSVVALEQAARLQRLYIETERQYGSTLGDPVETVVQQLLDDGHGQPFVAGATYAVTDRVHKTGTRNGLYYQVSAITTGIAGSEPAWPTTLNATVTTGGVTFHCEGVIPTLYTPVSPLFVIRKYDQKREPLWDAIRALVVTTFGGDLRYIWREATGQFELTLLIPNRAGGAAVQTFYPTATGAGPTYLGVADITLGWADVRNVVVNVWYDPTVPDPGGDPRGTRRTSFARDATSIGKYGRRYYQNVEDPKNLINTASEGQAQADAMLADLKDPLVSMSLVVPLFWAVQLGDMIGVAGNGTTHTNTQTLAVVGIRHEQQEGRAPTTTLALRGKPVSQVSGWLKLEARNKGVNAAPVLNGPDAPTSVAAALVQGGAAITWTPPLVGAWDSFEVHVSTTNGFTPSSATLVATSDTTYAPVPHLVPGTTYYAVVVARDLLGNRGTASAQVSFAAGYTPPRALTPQVVYTSLTPNPDFEAQSDVNAPPDGWAMATGTWGTDAQIDTTDVVGGVRAIKLPATGVQTKIRSALFPCVAAATLYGECWAKLDAPAASNLNPFRMEFEFFSDLGVTSTGTVQIGRSFIAAAYSLYSGIATAPAGTKYARVRIGKNDIGFDWVGHIDSVWVSKQLGTGGLEIIPFNGAGYGAAIYAANFADWGVGTVLDGRSVYNNLTGEVRLEGSFKSSVNQAAGATAFTTGFAPAKDVDVVVLYNNAPARATLTSGGAFQIQFAYVNPLRIHIPGFTYVVGR